MAERCFESANEPKCSAKLQLSATQTRATQDRQRLDQTQQRIDELTRSIIESLKRLTPAEPTNGHRFQSMDAFKDFQNDICGIPVWNIAEAQASSQSASRYYSINKRNRPGLIHKTHTLTSTQPDTARNEPNEGFLNSYELVKERILIFHPISICFAILNTSV